MPLYDDPIDWDSPTIAWDATQATLSPNRSAPTITGLMRESPDYQVMGMGLTDRIFLIGYGTLPLNDPYLVISMRDAVNKLGADSTSPLLRGMVEAYYSGGRDIWLMAAGPKVEYVSSLSDRLLPSSQLTNMTVAALVAQDPSYQIPIDYSVEAWNELTFYERYAARLDVTYSILREWDLPQMVVPIDAPFYDAGGVDFLTPLADHCLDAFETTGAIRLGFLGTLIPGGEMNDEHAAIISNDERLIDFDSDGLGGSTRRGKFVSIFAGEGVFNLKEMPTVYAGALTATIAGMMSNLQIDQGVTYKKLPNVLNLAGATLSADRIEELSQIGINPCIRSTMGKRGRSFEVIPATDNTLSLIGSDFWSLLQVRLVMKLIEIIRAKGRRYMGTVGFGQFKLEVQTFMYELVVENYIRGFDLDIYVQPGESIMDRTVMVNVAVQPFFGIRTISFSAEVGPNL